ncbi:8608_t:CDS:1 [Ambispora gerdemannii]|uniref:8608_t:CDS:1 n=1 Tax=Ambispora gerdemannii TaxID=144530 RepID=A0A9N8V3K6_9GLOM|nr:8608_t:CDS:1 [Ambispora gerdemannii]
MSLQQQQIHQRPQENQQQPQGYQQLQPNQQQANNTNSNLSAEKIHEFLYLCEAPFGLAVLKFLLVCIAEPIVSPQRNLINEECNDVFQAIDKFTDQNIQHICTELMNDFQSWYSSSQAELPHQLLEKIFQMLLLNSTQGYRLISNLSQYTVGERLSIRSIIYNILKGMSDFVSGSQSELFKRAENEQRIRNLERDNQKLLKELEQLKLHQDELLNSRHEVEKMNELEKQGLIDQCNSEKQGLIDQFNSEKQELIDQFNSEKQEHKNELQNLRRDNIQELEKERQTHYANLENLHTEDLLKEEQIDDLTRKHEAAVKEASKLQVALGSIRNVQWNEDDPNNPLQLIQEIKRIQKLLMDVTKVKGRQIQINKATANDLFNEYKIQTNDIKMVLSFSLQRFIFEKVHRFIEGLASYNKNVNDNNLESGIVFATEDLLYLMENFVETRSGDDDITRITPIKVRQHVYASLGSRGFNNSSHPIVLAITNELLEEMDKYREMLSEERKNRLNDQLAKLVIELIRFLFRLNTQEPLPEVKWVEEGKKIRNELMQGPWDFEDSDDLVVNFCYFPAIGTNLGDKKNLRIYCKAQVLPKPQSRSKVIAKTKNVLEVVSGTVSSVVKTVFS